MRLRLWLLLFACLASLNAAAQTVNFSNLNAAGLNALGICTGGSWSVAGNQYTCSGTLNFSAGVTYIANSNIEVVALPGINFNGNTIGAVGQPIDLRAQWGSVTTTGTNTVVGNITTSSGSITLSNTTASGNVTNSSGSITFNGSSITGNVSASSGALSVTNTTVDGNLTTNGTVTLNTSNITGDVYGRNGVTTTNSDVGGGVEANNAVNISGGSVGGSVTSNNNPVTISNADIGGGVSAPSGTINMTGSSVGGDIFTNCCNVQLTDISFTGDQITVNSNSLTLNGGDFGAPNNGIVIQVSNTVTLNDGATVYGEIFAGNWAGTIQVNGGSAVYGNCTPVTPECEEFTPLVLANDNFETYAIGSIVGNNGGSGWSGTWASAGGTQALIDTSADRMRYDAPNDEFILGGERALRITGNNDGIVSRTLPTTYNSDVIYVSMLLRAELGAGNNKFLGFWFGNSNSPNIGIKTNRGNGSSVEDFFARTALDNEAYSTDIVNGETYLLVGRMSKSTSGAGQPYNRFELWVNPNDLSDQPAFTGVSTAASSNITSFSQIGIRTVNLAGGDQIDIDRIAVGTSWSDVVTPSLQEITCFDDAFAALNIDDWITSVSSGSFTPSVVNGRLRMTEAVGNQATAATLQRFIPAADNLVVLQFDYYAYGGNGADGVAVVFSDASVTPLPGANGGSLGYAQKTNQNGFAGGWLGIGLDEFGNYSQANEGRSGGPGFRADAVAIRGSGSELTGYAYLAGTTSLTPGIDATGPTNPHRYRISIDSREAGQSMVSVERDTTGTGDNYTTLISSFNALAAPNQAAVPQNFLLSLTGSTGDSTNIHEFGNFQICAEQITPVGPQLQNVELSFASSALTCQPSEVTVRACQNEDCSELYTDEVTVNLTPVDGWVGGSSVTFSGGTTTVDFQRTSEGNSLLGVSGATPTITAFTEARCIRDGELVAANQCQMAFADTGFVFDVPDVLANRPTTGITVAAVYTDDETQECVPAFANVTRTLNFWSDYVSPNATGRPVSWPVSVNSTDVGLTSGTATALPLSFNASGVAEISVQYADAGSMQLNARYTGSVANGDDGLVMLGSDQFVSRPVGITLEAANGCTTADVSCNNRVVAGANYTLTATARAWQVDGDTDLSDNPVTPNFQLNNIALSHAVLAPAGGQLGTLGRTTYNHVPAANGVTTIADQSVSEVGVFTFTATVPAYFGALLENATATTGNSARFIPASIDYDVQSFSFSALPMARDFVYQGQNFGLNIVSSAPPVPAVVITARNLAGQRTVNYAGSFFRSPNNVATTIEHDAVNMTTAQVRTLQASGTTLYHLNTELDVSKNYSGWLTFTLFNYPQWRYERAGTANELTANEAPQEIRGIWTIPQVSLEDLEVCTGANCADSATLTQALGGPDLVYGRMRLRDVQGPVQVPLDMPVQFEVWDGTRFSLYGGETGGAQTLLHGNNFVRTLAPDVGNLELNDVSMTWNSAVAGEGRLSINVLPAAITAGRNEGVYNITASGAPAYLFFDWNGDGAAQAPAATASFGFYTGRAPLLFRMPTGR